MLSVAGPYITGIDWFLPLRIRAIELAEMEKRRRRSHVQAILGLDGAAVTVFFERLGRSSGGTRKSGREAVVDHYRDRVGS